MNEKVSFLKFFFESGKFSDSTLTGHIVDLFPAIVYVYDADSGRIKYVNKRFEEFFGSRPNHITDALHTVHPDDVSTVENALEKLHRLDENESHTYINRVQTGDGEWKSFHTEATVLSKRNDGKAAAVLFIVRDITDELQNRLERDAFHEILDDTEDLLQFGSWTIDSVTQTMTWTDGLYKLLGYPSRDRSMQLSLSFYLSHVTNDNRKNVAEIFESSLRYQDCFEAEFDVKTKSGIQKIVFTKAKFLKDEAGSGRLIGITRDITALRNFEREQERSIRELNRSNRELEEFAYVASHDLQEPIRKVSMYTDRLKSKLSGSIDAESLLFIDRIQNASANMRELVDNLLEFSRANRGAHNFERVDLALVLNQVLSDLELKIAETSSSITIHGKPPVIDGVATEMKQVFSNLLSNAIKFRKKEQPANIQVAFSPLTTAEKLAHRLPVRTRFFRIEIVDNGIGFDSHDAQKIFEIFQRLHSKTEYPGTGIGLSICKKIIENHNGVIFANSSPEQGSTFTIILPEKHY